MMTIRIEIAGREVERFTVVNDGGPNDATEYVVSDAKTARVRHVTHDRTMGAVALAVAALGAMDRGPRAH
jgi:hypothetical protein